MKSSERLAKGELPGEVKMVPLGDSALVVRFGDSIAPETHRRVRQLTDYLQLHPFAGMIECVPAFASVTIYYEPLTLLTEYGAEAAAADRDFPYGIACALAAGILRRLRDDPVSPARVVEIPVCYGGEWGPDLDEVAEHNGLTREEVIRLHASADYLVYMLGFAPGFAYLGGMSERIATPRRQTPRLAIPAGTVAIGGGQTGVYPIETPGGWQCIGRTPVDLFLPRQMPPALLKAGDVVRFCPIDRNTFDRWKESQT